ncbi:hypothetical protein KU70_04570 [Campylobacter fetus]|nr:hypothetical protein KU70_04570 [Campylobacter fetus]
MSSNLVEAPVAQVDSTKIDEIRVTQIIDEKLQGQSLQISDEKISQAVEEKIANNETLSTLIKAEVAKNKTSLGISDIIAFS